MCKIRWAAILTSLSLVLNKNNTFKKYLAHWPAQGQHSQYVNKWQLLLWIWKTPLWRRLFQHCLQLGQLPWQAQLLSQGHTQEVTGLMLQSSVLFFPSFATGWFLFDCLLLWPQFLAKWLAQRIWAPLKLIRISKLKETSAPPDDHRSRATKWLDYPYYQPLAEWRLNQVQWVNGSRSLAFC